MKELAQRIDIDLQSTGQPCVEGLELGSKGKGVLMVIVIQGLYPDAVSEEIQAFLKGVPDGKGKHADKFLNAMRPPGGEGLEDNLGVRCASEENPSCRKVFPDLLIIVDLPVVGEDVPPIAGAHGLVPCLGKVYDRKSPVTQGQSCLVFEEDSCMIGTSSGHAVTHSNADVLQIGTDITFPDASDSTHEKWLSYPREFEPRKSFFLQDEDMAGASQQLASRWCAGMLSVGSNNPYSM